MDLSGHWTLKLDQNDEGIAQAWFTGTLPAPDGTLRLPGSLQAQGFGDPPGLGSPWIGDVQNPLWHQDPRYAPYTTPENFKFPFWLQPKTVFVGPAWYQREITIPSDWQGQRVTLTLERAHWGTRAWLDGTELRPAEPGGSLSLSTPHVYVLDGGWQPGAHTLTLRVDNRMIINVGPNSHSMSDHTQTDWNGVIGQITMQAAAPVWIEEVQVYPNVAERSARVAVRVGNALGQPGMARLTLWAHPYGKGLDLPEDPDPLTVEIALDPQETSAEVVYPLGDGAMVWNEFHPLLYRLEVSLEATAARQSFTDRREVTFGLREIRVDGTQLAINGKRIFLRGTLECCIFPRTGYPPTDVEAWKRILRVARGYGLNQLRFHSYCPPEAAFQAADEMGFYYQVECASWANQGACLGEGDALDAWLYEEGRRIITAYGNHPSFVMMAYGNEPGGKFEEYLTDWVTYWKRRDPRRVYTSGAGWPAIEANQYHNVPAPRVQAWGEELNSRINALPPETLTDYTSYVQKAQKPVVSHEIGQWCVYPNFAEIDKYTGHLQAKNFEIFRESLEKNSMGDQAQDFLIASGKLQVLCYKEDIESALRTPGFAGFHLLDLHDFPGQGTALVGVLDPFWEEKGYVTGAEYSRFCNAIVPLARLAKRSWLEGETFHAEIDIANFYRPLTGVTPAWSLTGADGQIAASGTLPMQDIPLGNTAAGGGPIRLGSVDVDLRGLAAPQKLVFIVRLPGMNNPNSVPVENDWDVWLFPAALDTAAPPEVLVTGALDEAARQRLAQGGRVLLLLPPEQVKTESKIGFSSMFWNVEWTGYQAPHTLGILVDPQHPVFNAFPTERHSNWQWWELIHGSAAMHIDSLPRGLRPLVQPIDAWANNRRLALLFEARLGAGRLMVASMDLEKDLDRRPVARQLRQSILQYMQSPSFAPQQELTAEEISKLIG